MACELLATFAGHELFQFIQLHFGFAMDAFIGELFRRNFSLAHFAANIRENGFSSDIFMATSGCDTIMENDEVIIVAIVMMFIIIVAVSYILSSFFLTFPTQVYPRSEILSI